MIQEISWEDFESATIGNRNMEYLREYVDKGFIVYRDKKTGYCYVHDSPYDFKIDNADDLKVFFQNPDKYRIGPKPEMKMESIYKGLNPDNEHWPDITFLRIGQLSKVMGIPLSSGKEVKETALRAVDSFIRQQPDPKAFKKQYFMSFVALLGEAVITAYPAHCRWAMRLDSIDHVTWSMDVYYDDKFLGLVRLYDNLFSANEDEPLQSAFDAIDLIINVLCRKD